MNFYNSAIEANSLYKPQQYQGTMDRFANAKPQNMASQMPRAYSGFSPDQMGAFNRMLGGNFNAERQRQGLDFQRNYAQANAAHLLGAEQARAQSGLQGYQGMMNSNFNSGRQQQQMSSMLMNLLFPMVFG